MWFGIVYRRWNLVGIVAFVAAQVTVLLAAALVVIWADAWPSVDHFFTGLTSAGLTGLLAVLAVVLLAGGHATVRRAAV
jgi:polyferredoxin